MDMDKGAGLLMPACPCYHNRVNLDRSGFKVILWINLFSIQMKLYPFKENLKGNFLQKEGTREQALCKRKEGIAIPRSSFLIG